MSIELVKSYIEKISAGLTEAGMTDTEVNDTIYKIVEIMYEEIVHDKIDAADIDKYMQLKELNSSELTLEKVDELLDLNVETITKLMTDKLHQYNENLQKNLPSIKQEYAKYKLGHKVIDKLKDNL